MKNGNRKFNFYSCNDFKMFLEFCYNFNKNALKGLQTEWNISMRKRQLL